MRRRNAQPIRTDAGDVVRTNASQTSPNPPSNQRTKIQANSTDNHIVEAPMMSGVRVSPLPRRPPLLTNQSAQNGKARLSAFNAATPAAITSGSAEKRPMARSPKMKASTPPIPIQTMAQRSAMVQAVLASDGTRAPIL